MVLQKTVGFIGAGQMAEALARGFVSKGVIDVGSVHATDPSKVRRDLFASFGAHSYEKNVQVTYSSPSLSAEPCPSILEEHM